MPEQEKLTKQCFTVAQCEAYFQVHIYTYKNTETQKHTQTRVHTHTHTHTLTHKHSQMLGREVGTKRGRGRERREDIGGAGGRK